MCGPLEGTSTTGEEVSESVRLEFKHGSTCAKWSGIQRVSVGLCETDAKERGV